MKAITKEQNFHRVKDFCVDAGGNKATEMWLTGGQLGSFTS